MRAKYIDVTKVQNETIFKEIGEAIRERKIGSVSN